MTRLIRKVGHLELWGVGPERSGGRHRLYEVVDTTTLDRGSRFYERRREADAHVQSGARINADSTIMLPQD